MSAAARPVDRTTVILAIRWRYALAILDGTKRREFRRRVLPQHVQRALILPTGRRPASHARTPKGVLGMFDFAGQSWEPVQRWVTLTPRPGTDVQQLVTLPGCGIDPRPLAQYAGGYAENVAAIEVAGRPVRFPCSVPLADLGLARSPQSWQYAPAGWREVVAAEVLLSA